MRTIVMSIAILSMTLVVLIELPRKDAPEDGPIGKLIEQLGDDRFATREAASKALEALGDKALTALVNAAATSPDLETRRRARRLILAVMPATFKSKSLGLTMTRIDSGDFQMGSPLTETNRRGDEPLHRVNLRKPFYLGTHEVTQDEYQKVTKINPSWFTPKGAGSEKVQGQITGAFPVERVSWFDAIEFCNELSKNDGFTSCYVLSDVKREGTSISSARITLIQSNGYRLPTEAEWEYACRSMTTAAFHFGRDLKVGEVNAKPIMVGSGYGVAPRWPDLGRTCKVGSFPANRWGLCDMHGNVAEWCWDWYDRDYYTVSPLNDPTGPAKGTHRVLRGGSWLVTEGSCRCASRYFQTPTEKDYHIGFRVARNP